MIPRSFLLDIGLSVARCSLLLQQNFHPKKQESMDVGILLFTSIVHKPLMRDARRPSRSSELMFCCRTPVVWSRSMLYLVPIRDTSTFVQNKIQTQRQLIITCISSAISYFALRTLCCILLRIAYLVDCAIFSTSFF